MMPLNNVDKIINGIPEENNIYFKEINKELFSSDVSRDFEKLIRMITDYWYELQNEYSEKYPNLKKVNFYLFDTASEIYNFSRVYLISNAFRPSFDDFSKELIEQMDGSKNTSDFYVLMLSTLPSSVMMVGILNEIFKIFMLLYSFMTVDEMFENHFKISVRHEMGHAIHFITILTENNAYESTKIVKDLQDKTKKMNEEYDKTPKENRMDFLDFYYSQLPFESKANEIMNIPIDVIKKSSSFIEFRKKAHDDFKKRLNEITDKDKGDKQKSLEKKDKNKLKEEKKSKNVIDTENNKLFFEG